MSENKEPAVQFEIGDTVYVNPYKTRNMNGELVEGWPSGKTGIILKLTKKYDWQRAPTGVNLRIMSDDGRNAESAWMCPIEHLTLVSKGPGRVELGVTHPFSQDELREQRWEAYVEAAHAADLTHQEFCNQATFMAHLYLDQDTRFRKELPSLWRKDGTVNPDKVRKAFHRLGLQVDPEVFECPVEAPEEFRLRPNPIAGKLNIDWDEVAAEFTRDTVEDSYPPEVAVKAA